MPQKKTKLSMQWKFVRATLGHIEPTLGQHWGHIGATLGQHWGNIGATVGQHFCHIGATLGQHWGEHGAALGQHYGHIGATMGQHWGHNGATLGTLRATQELLDLRPTLPNQVCSRRVPKNAPDKNEIINAVEIRARNVGSH